MEDYWQQNNVIVDRDVCVRVHPIGHLYPSMYPETVDCVCDASALFLEGIEEENQGHGYQHEIDLVETVLENSDIDTIRFQSTVIDVGRSMFRVAVAEPSKWAKPVRVNMSTVTNSAIERTFRHSLVFVTVVMEIKLFLQTVGFESIDCVDLLHTNLTTNEVVGRVKFADVPQGEPGEHWIPSRWRKFYTKQRNGRIVTLDVIHDDRQSPFIDDSTSESEPSSISSIGQLQLSSKPSPMEEGKGH